MADQNVTVAITLQDNITGPLRAASEEARRLNSAISGIGGRSTVGAAATQTKTLASGMAAAGTAAAGMGRATATAGAATRAAGASMSSAATGASKLSSGMSSAGKSSRGLHTSLVGLGGGVTNLRAAFGGINATTATLAVGFSTMVATLSSFGKEMSWVRVAASDSADDFAKLSGEILKLGDGSLGYGPTQAATAVSELGKAGVKTADVIGGGLNGALSLAASGQIEVGEAAEVAASSMNQFRLSGASIPHIADLLSASAAKAQGSVHDMSLGLRQSGLVANMAGLSIEETTAAMAAFAKSGLVGSDAGTSFKSMLLMLTPTTVAAKRMMDSLGLSAFDAQGNFVGLANYAGQLKDALSGMSDEQQQESLKTMFGPDAIRASSALFEQGEKGINEWIDAVSDAGHASRTASGLMDNLNGDVKKLWAAFQSTTVTEGSGLNGVLRGGAQTATAMVTALKDVPPMALAAGVGLTALMAVSGRLREANVSTAASFAAAAASAKAYGASLAAAGANMGAAKTGLMWGSSGPVMQTGAATAGLSAMTRSMNVAKVAAGGLRTVGSGLFGLIGGPWGLALTAGTILLGRWAQGQADAAAASERTKDQVSTLASTLKDSTGAITAATRKSVSEAVINDDTLKTWKDLGVTSGTITNAILGQASATQSLNTQLDAQKTRLEGIVQDWTQYTENGPVVVGQGEDAQRDLVRLEALRAKVAELSGGLKDGQQSVQDLAREEDAAAKSTDGYTDEARVAAAAVESVEVRTKRWTDALKNLSAQFDKEASLDAYTRGLLDLKKNIDDSSTALKGNSRAALTNRDALRDQVDAGIDYIQTLIDGKAPAKAIAAASKTLADRLDEAGRKAGLAKDQVKLYSDRLRDVPKKITTVIKADTAPAKTTIQSLFDKWSGRTISVRVGVSSPSAIAAANADGGVVLPRADGGFASNGAPVPRVPQVGSKRDRYILWNEPETDQEAYISNKPGMRARNIAVAREAASWFGMTLIPKDALSAYANGGLAGKFVDLLKTQIGDSYKWGAGHYAKFRRVANPAAYDCSSFVHWGLGRTIGRDVMNATAGMRGSGLYTTIGLDKAINTKGAVLWKPGHTAVSDGTGKTVEAMNKDRGVTAGNAKGRFTIGLWPKAFGSIDAAQKDSGDTGSTMAGTSSSTTPFSASIKATASETATRNSFAGNVAKIANAGYGSLASSLLAANDDQAWVNAAALAKLSPAKLKSAAGTYAASDRAADALTALAKAFAASTATKTTLAAVTASKAFLTNVKWIASKGYGPLAATMIEGGEDTYGAIAAELAKDRSGVKLRAYAGAQTATEQVKKQLDDLAVVLRGGLTSVALKVGESTITDPTVQWGYAQPGRSASAYMYPPATSNSASTGGGGPLVNIQTVQAFDAQKLVAAITAPLGDALALAGIGQTS